MREKIADMASSLILDTDVVILGVGIPLLCLPFLSERNVLVVCENGAIGLRNTPRLQHIVDAGRNSAALKAGGSTVDSVEMFSIIRSGRIDAAVVGALEVDMSGNIACHSTIDRLFGYGGAVDIYCGVKRVIATLPEDRFVRKLSLPISGVGAVSDVITERGHYVL